MTTSRTRAAALIAAILTVAGCGGGGGNHDGSRVPAAAEIGGTYDLTTTFRGSTEPPRSGVGVLGVGDELHIELSDPPAVMSGVLRRDGHVRLDGQRTATDVIASLQATARVRLIGDAYWLTGTIETLDVDFAMTRPVKSDLRAASGRYRLTFAPRLGSCACTSTIDLDAEIGVGGSITLPPEHAVNERGAVLADLSFATLDVAPSGRFHFEATYVEPDGGCGSGIEGGPCLLRVDGSLPQTGESTAHYDLLTGLRSQTAAGDLRIGRLP